MINSDVCIPFCVQNAIKLCVNLDLLNAKKSTPLQFSHRQSTYLMTFPHQIPSIALAIGIISVVFIFEIPVFPDQRDSNKVSELSKFILCTGSCLLLLREWKSQKKTTPNFSNVTGGGHRYLGLGKSTI